jgi:hypothetical protein
LNNEELANRLNKWWLSGARSKLNRGGDQAELVDIQMLTIDQQAAFSIDCIQRALGSDALSKKQRKKMENVARGSSNDFPTYNVVEWAISLMPGRKKGDKDKKDEE